MIQFGGDSNLRKFRGILDWVRQNNDFSKYFRDWKGSWHFARAPETKKLLDELGLEDIKISFSYLDQDFSNVIQFTKFIKTVVMSHIFFIYQTKPSKKRF